MSSVDPIVEEYGVRAVLNRYAQLLDDFRFSDIEELFTENVEISFPGYHHVGREGFGEAMRSACSFVSKMQHMSTNMTVQIAGAAVATSRSNCIAFVVTEGSGDLLVESGRYTHALRKSDGRWRIEKISFEVVWTHGYDEANDPAGKH